MGVFFTEQEMRDLIPRREKCLEPADYTWAKLHHSEKPVYFFGTGAFSRRLYDTCRMIMDPLRPAGILDNNPALAGTMVDGLPVSLPGDPKVRAADPLVVLLTCRTTSQAALAMQCAGLGYEFITSDELLLVPWPKLDPGVVENDPGAAAALEVWDDEDSRERYRTMLRARILRDAGLLPPGEATAEQYFVPLVPREYYRHFVDAGAYDGDTYLALRRAVGEAYDRYYAFEPGAETFSRLEAATAGDARVERHRLALLDAKKTVSFTVNDVNSAVTGEGGEVPADRLDDVLAGRRVSFIKMDVEGSELAALEGAKGLIREQRPVLAICTYHRLSDQWNIPLWIKRLEPSYRLYLRRHGAALLETVCYALPS